MRNTSRVVSFQLASWIYTQTGAVWKLSQERNCNHMFYPKGFFLTDPKSYFLDVCNHMMQIELYLLYLLFSFDVIQVFNIVTTLYSVKEYHLFSWTWSWMIMIHSFLEASVWKQPRVNGKKNKSKIRGAQLISMWLPIVWPQT